MGISTELKKALVSSGDGAALQPYDLDPFLHEELLKLQPLLELMDVIQAEGKTHEYNVRSSHPAAWFEGETAPANQQSGAYVRKTVSLKIQRIWGGVTGFAQTVDEGFIDALALELEGSLEGMANTFEYGALFGTANDIGFTGDAYQFSGIIPRVFAYAPGNVIDAGGNKITLDDMDAALAKVQGFRQVRNDPKLWMMGLRMKQIVDGLQTKVQLPLTQAELADGKIVMDAYGKAPILESDFVVPASTSTSPAVTGTKAAGGSLADGVYLYQISSVTLFGEQIAGTADGDTTETTNNTVNLTWTADANAKLYMIWRKKDSEDYKLLDIIAAKTYDSAGTVNGSVESYSDTGARDSSLIAVKPLLTGEQQIVLVDVNPNRGAAFVGKIDSRGQRIDKLVTFQELAMTKDSYDYFLKSYLALRLVHPNLVAVIRHAKLA